MTARATDLLSAACGRHHPVGARVAAWVAAIPAKVLARRFGVSPRTAKAWRGGEVPQVRHLWAMAEAWGPAFIDHIFAPLLAAPDAGPEIAAAGALGRRLDRLEAELSGLRRLLAEEDTDAPSRVRPTSTAAATGGPVPAAGRGAGAAGAAEPARALPRPAPPPAAEGPRGAAGAARAPSATGRRLGAWAALALALLAGWPSDDALARAPRPAQARPPIVRIGGARTGGRPEGQV